MKYPSINAPEKMILMKICYFGSYKKTYPRNKVILKGLEKNNIDIIECNDTSHIIVRFFRLIQKALKNDMDIIFVAYPGHLDILPAKIVSILKRKPIVFDAFISTYDTMINEWKYGTRYSPKGIYYHALDKISCSLADVILLDTESHIDYFTEEFKMKRDKFRSIPVGTDESETYPQEKKTSDKKFRVLYYGNIQPLHGFEYIVDAARKLQNDKDIEFTFIGGNRWFRNVRDKNKDLKNSTFSDPIPYEKLLQHIRDSDVSLGIFGTTIKTQNAIPNKAYEAIAMKKPLITGDTKAARTVFKNKENAILCDIGSSDAIKDAILFLKNNPEERQGIAENGYNLYTSNFTTYNIGKKLKTVLEQINPDR